MPKTKDEEADKRKKRAQQFAALKEEHAKRKTLPIEFELPEVAPEEEEDVAFNHDAVIKAYKEQFPDREIKEDNRLNFGSIKEAENFFQDLANKKVPFIAIEVDANGQPTGTYMMSTGDGNFKKGKVDPEQINQVISDFKESMKPAEPEPSKAPNQVGGRS